jgi:hypothetical protein
MGDAAYLVANNSPRPVGTPPDQEPTYEDEDCMAYAKWTIPILWISLFVEDDLKVFESIDGDCLAPVTSLRKARLNWSRRKSRLEETFPHNRPEIEGWERAIAQLQVRYIKIDATELWSMAVGLEEEEYEANLRGGVRWFDTGDDTDFERLLGLLWRQDAYDRATKAFKETGDVPFMFYGHPLRLPPLGEVGPVM